MSPIEIRDTKDSGQVYATPFVGPIDHTAPVQVDPSGLFGSDFLDAYGWLKPGALFLADGTLAAANAADQAEDVYGVTLEGIHLVRPGGAAPTQAELDALANRSIIVATIGQLNRDIMEDNLGRALTVAEVAAIGRSQLILIG